MKKIIHFSSVILILVFAMLFILCSCANEQTEKPETHRSVSSSDVSTAKPDDRTDENSPPDVDPVTTDNNQPENDTTTTGDNRENIPPVRDTTPPTVNITDDSYYDDNKFIYPGGIVKYKVWFSDNEGISTINLEEDSISLYTESGESVSCHVLVSNYDNYSYVYISEISGRTGKYYFEIAAGAAVDNSGNETLKVKSKLFEYRDDFFDTDMSIECKINYYEDFAEDYSPEKYTAIYEVIKNNNENSDIIPLCQVGSHTWYVQRIIETYNYSENSVTVINIDNGNESDGWHTDWPKETYKNIIIANYLIVKVGESGSANRLIDIIDENGNLIARTFAYDDTFDGINNSFFDLGDGYLMILDLRGFNLLNSEGRLVGVKRNGFSPYSFGKFSEDLCYYKSSGSGYYFNTDGEIVINLWQGKTNFKITSMYDFSDGKARLEFTGADGNDYFAYIDKTGNFIDEPQLME